MFKLDEQHLDKAKEFAVHNRKKKSCNNCYDRGYIGTTPENTLVLCPKCVDVDKVMEAWKTVSENQAQADPWHKIRWERKGGYQRNSYGSCHIQR